MSLFNRNRKPEKTPVYNGVHSGTPVVLEMISGQLDPTDPAIGPEIIVNPLETLPTGWGNENAQQFQSGVTNNVKTNQSAEQGFGVGPERMWAHYPHVEQPNPFRRLNIMQRDGGDSYSTLVYRPEVVAYWAMALQMEADVASTRNRAQAGVVNQAPSVPFVATIPPVMPGGY